MIIQSRHNISDYYFDFLKDLDTDSKLVLISRLKASLKDEKETVPLLHQLFGAYKSEETADEIIAAIKVSKVFNRTTEKL